MGVLLRALNLYWKNVAEIRKKKLSKTPNVYADKHGMGLNNEHSMYHLSEQDFSDVFIRI